MIPTGIHQTPQSARRRVDRKPSCLRNLVASHRRLPRLKVSLLHVSTDDVSRALPESAMSDFATRRRSGSPRATRRERSATTSNLHGEGAVDPTQSIAAVGGRRSGSSGSAIRRGDHRAHRARSFRQLRRSDRQATGADHCRYRAAVAVAPRAQGHGYGAPLLTQTSPSSAGLAMTPRLRLRDRPTIAARSWWAVPYEGSDGRRRSWVVG